MLYNCPAGACQFSEVEGKIISLRDHDPNFHGLDTLPVLDSSLNNIQERDRGGRGFSVYKHL